MSAPEHSVRVSVIIPTLDEAPNLSTCVASARRAGATQIVVADGGSRDDTVCLARSLADVVIQTEPGRARQQNLGAAQADGDVLLFLHADNWLSQHAVAQIQKLVVTDGDQVCGGFEQEIDDTRWVYRWLEKGNALRVMRLGWAYGDQGIFVGRGLFESIGGFPDWPLMEDVELMRRLVHRAKTDRALASPRLLPGPIGVSARRWRRKGVVRQTLRNWALLSAWCCGVSPTVLARFYPSCPSRDPSDQPNIPSRGR